MRRRGPFRDGKVHVMRKMCDSCIFRPGNRMRLKAGRVEQMVVDATKADSCIPCHKTLDGRQAVCAGFFRKYATAPLQIADRLGFITFVDGVKEAACNSTGQ